MSTTEMNAELGVTQAPGSSDPLGDEAAHRRRDHCVRQVDLQLVEARLRLRCCAFARSSCAAAAWYRASVSS